MLPRGFRTVRTRDAVPGYLLGFVLIGVVLTVAAPALSHLRDRMGTDDGGIAWMFVGSSVGYIAGSASAGRLIDGGNAHRWWVTAMAVDVAALVLVGEAPDLGLLVLAFALLGAAAGLSDVSGNTLVMWSRPDGAGSLLNALHLCFAVGALTAPLLVNRSIRWFGSVSAVAVPVGLLALAAATVLLRHPAPARTRLDTVARSEAGGARTMHVGLVCAFFFSYVALETGFAGWIHTYVEQIRYGDATTATAVVTVFWGGFTAGRMAAIALSRRMSPGALVGWSMAVSVVAAVLFALFPDGGPMLWAVTFLFAVSIAPQYASMMAFAEAHLALSGRNTAAIVGASGVGGLVAPWLLGQLFDVVGPESLPPVMVVLAVLASAAAGVAGRAIAPRPRAVSDRR